MIIVTSTNTKANWMQVRDYLIGGLEYSYGTSGSYSLDEKLNVNSITSGTVVTAERLVDTIGDDVFKKLIEYILDPRYSSRRIDFRSRTSKVAGLIMCINRNNTPEGRRYWDIVADKLYTLDSTLNREARR